MRIRVLGSAAGGGFPQWNCGCDNCKQARAAAVGFRARTQESVAISADDESWFLLNASPEVRAQIESFTGLHPRERRHSPIAGIVLTNGDLDHCLGLLSLRESHPLRLITTSPIERGFREDNVLFRTLQRFEGQLKFQALELNKVAPLLLADGKESGLTIEAVPVAGKLPIHLEKQSKPSPEDSIGLLIREPAKNITLGYFSGVAGPTDALRAALQQADCIFFDGTFWSEDELPARGLLEKKAKDMAHWPIGGEHGSASWLGEVASKKRRIYIHINNTNPILNDGGSETAQLRAAGFDIADDGMELTL